MVCIIGNIISIHSFIQYCDFSL